MSGRYAPVLNLNPRLPPPPEREPSRTDRARAWLSRHYDQVALAVFGVLLLADAWRAHWRRP